MQLLAADGVLSVVYNVVGGIIVAGGTLGISRLYRRCLYRRFRQVFGHDVAKDVCLKYPGHEISKDIVLRKRPTRVRRGTKNTTNLTDATSESSMRAVAYLAASYGVNANAAPRIEADDTKDDVMDLSFASVGGANNERSNDVLMNPNNVFFGFEGDYIVEKESSRRLAGPGIMYQYDYGLILKIHPHHNPRRTWICCAGIGSWGSSGAAWYLANRWQVIWRTVKDRSFGCITKTTWGSDDSTVLFGGPFLTRKEMERVSAV